MTARSITPMARTSNRLNILSMKSPSPLLRHLTAAIVLLAGMCLVHAADSPGWAGQYREEKFLGGRAVFQLSIEQSGNKMQVSFDAAWVRVRPAKCTDPSNGTLILPSGFSLPFVRRSSSPKTSTDT